MGVLAPAAIGGGTVAIRRCARNADEADELDGTNDVRAMSMADGGGA